ncbi:MAG: AAA family ATPase [Synergistaceae bacterium]|nr:AAA family ATPase [Synergistaceae bacterium]
MQDNNITIDEGLKRDMFKEIVDEALTSESPAVPPEAEGLLRYMLPRDWMLNIPARGYVNTPQFLPGLERGMVGILAAAGGTGKSYFCLEYGLAAAAGGLDIFGSAFPLLQEPIRILYLPAEDTRDQISNRLYSIWHCFIGKYQAKLRWADVADNFMIAPLHGHGAPSITSNDSYDLLNRLLIDIKPDVLILDPLVQFYKANENDNNEMNAVIKRFEQLAADCNMAVLLCHHVNKSAAYNGSGGMQQAARGASAIIDGARWMLTLDKIRKASESEYLYDRPEIADNKVRVTLAKANNHKPVPPFTLVRNDAGVLTYNDDSNRI